MKKVVALAVLAIVLTGTVGAQELMDRGFTVEDAGEALVLHLVGHRGGGSAFVAQINSRHVRTPEFLYILVDGRQYEYRFQDMGYRHIGELDRSVITRAIAQVPAADLPVLRGAEDLTVLVAAGSRRYRHTPTEAEREQLLDVARFVAGG